MTLRELLWGGERRSQVIQKCCNKGQVVWASKYDCKLKKTRYLKLRNLSIFWEDASLDSLKSSLSYASSHQTWGPCPVFFTSWASMGLTLGSGCNLMVCVCSAAQSCPTVCDPMDCILPGPSVHGIFQARIPEWLPFPPPGALPNPKTEPESLESPPLAGGFLTTIPSGRPKDIFLLPECPYSSAARIGGL